LESAHLGRATDLVDAYADLRLGTVHTAIEATAERLYVTRIPTLDHRHFTVGPFAHIASFELVSSSSYSSSP
jgi:hypothetical protein